MALILITGGAGFIGSRTASTLLQSGFRVRVLDNLSAQIHGAAPVGLRWLEASEVDFVCGSIANHSDIAKAIEGVDAIVHLAAETGTGQSMYQISNYTSVNVLGTANILDYLANNKNHQVRQVVLASSRSVYGEGAYVCKTCGPTKRIHPECRTNELLSKQLWDPMCEICGSVLTPVPTHEDDPTNPASIYAATKLAQEEMVRVACSSLNIGHIILRLQNVYGEGQSLNNPYTGILSIFSTRIRRREVLPIFEDGKETRDFVHVDDVAKAFLAALDTKNASSQTINVGTGTKVSVARIATELSHAFGVRPNQEITGQFRLGDIRNNWADTTRLKNVLGLEAKITLSEGMERFAAWVQNQPLPEDGLDSANSELIARKLMG